jgi:hypothetical protein
MTLPREGWPSGNRSFRIGVLPSEIQMLNIDGVVRRLRARVSESSNRERSLDWISADALEKLHADKTKLRE